VEEKHEAAMLIAPHLGKGKGKTFLRCQPPGVSFAAAHKRKGEGKTAVVYRAGKKGKGYSLLYAQGKKKATLPLLPQEKVFREEGPPAPRGTLFFVESA